MSGVDAPRPTAWRSTHSEATPESTSTGNLRSPILAGCDRPASGRRWTGRVRTRRDAMAGVALHSRACQSRRCHGNCPQSACPPYVIDEPRPARRDAGCTVSCPESCAANRSHPTRTAPPPPVSRDGAAGLLDTGSAPALRSTGPRPLAAGCQAALDRRDTVAT